VILTKRVDGGVDDPCRTFDEWHSDADTEADTDL
jgi:hypothetical protein